jgi:hypothetical protein
MGEDQSLMKLYLDDDVASAVLVRMLAKAAHDVVRPVDAGLLGVEDPVHFWYAIDQSRTLLTGNHRDYLRLHNLVIKAQGHHPGVIAIRRDNDPRRDLTDRGAAVALRNLESSGLALADGFFILNDWR